VKGAETTINKNITILPMAASPNYATIAAIKLRENAKQTANNRQRDIDSNG
jgi:hypothetical protein